MTILYKKFGKEKRWVNWRYVRKDGKITKVPVGREQKLAKSNDDSTWMTYEEASLSENIGIMATPDKKTLLVDFDNCIDSAGKISRPEIFEFVEASDTYTEISPSGNGLHLFFTLTEPLELTSNKHAVNDKEKIECYTHGRYFTVTNKPFGKAKKVREVTKEQALDLLSIIGYPWKIEEASADSRLVTSSPSLASSEILPKMFASKNGAKIKALYEGDISSYNNDESSADMAFLNHLAFWTGKNPQKMEDLWLSSPLGSRKKTQSRKDYRDRTIKAAIARSTEVYTVTPEPVSDDSPLPKEKIEFLTQMKGKNEVVAVNTENVIRILTQHSKFKNTIRLAVFESCIEVFENSKWRTIRDADVIRIQCEIATMFPPFIMLNPKIMWDAIVATAEKNQYDSPIVYLSSLTWDKIPRLDTWLSKVYGTKDDIYHRAVGSNWLKGLVSRLVYPGCKFDHVLVIEGPQGTKKSTSLNVLGNGWHLETTMATDNKDFFMQFAGKAIIEFSEGETFSRTEVKRLKAIITMQNDKFRPPWGRTSQEFPRRCVFAMTTNEAEYLKDDTGNRRWLPVTLVLPEADIEWLKNNRDQLFAETYHRVAILNEPIHEFPMEEMKAEQMKRKTRDPSTDLLIDWYMMELKEGDRASGITITQAYKVISGGYIHKAMSKTEEMNIASIFRDALGLEKQRVMLGGSRVIRWYRPEGTPDPMEGKEVSVLDQLRDF